MHLDLVVLALMTLSVLVASEVLKRARPALFAGREKLLPIGVGLAAGIVARIADPAAFAISEAGWWWAIAGGLIAGILAQLVHDKLLAAILQLVPKGKGAAAPGPGAGEQK